MKPFESPSGSTWFWRSHRDDVVDIFVVLNGHEMDEQYGYECRRVFVIHSDDNDRDEGYGTISEGSPYNENSTRLA